MINKRHKEDTKKEVEDGKNSNLSNMGIGAIILYSESERKGVYG